MKKSSHKIRIWSALWFLLLTFVLYGPSMDHGYNIDDNYVIEDHDLAQQGIKGIPDIFSSRYHDERDQQFGYRPLTIALYAIEYQIFGENLSIFHFLNLLWYAGLLFVLFILFRKLFPQVSLWFILIALTIFAVHPIHSEVVLSLKNREEILCLLLASLAWIQFIKFNDHRKPWSAIIGVILLVLAFLAKETAVIFVAIIPLSLWFFRSRALEKKSAGIQHASHVSSNTHIFIALIQVLLMIGFFTDPAFIKNFTGQVLSRVLQLMVFTLIGLWLLKKNNTKPLIKIKHHLLIISAAFFLLSIFVAVIAADYGKYTFMLCLLFFAAYTHHQRVDAAFSRIRQLKIPKYFWFILGIGALLSIALFVIYIIPKISLPEQNAPVYNWQNPLFMDKTVVTKIGVVFYSLAWYLKLLFLPFPLRFYYGYALVPAAGISDPVVIVSILLHLALLYVMFKGLKKRKIWSFAIAFYFIGIIPFSNLFFPLTGIIAERLLFIPSLGFALGITWLIFRILNERIDFNKPKKRSSLVILSLLIILPFSVLSMKRTPDWKNRKSLYEADMPKLEKSAKANNLYANFLVSKIYAGMKAGVPLQKMDAKIKSAIKHFKLAIEVDSTYANPYHNLGYIYLIVARDNQKAEENFTNAIKHDSTIYEAWMNRGVARFYQKKLEEAEDDLNYSKKHGFRKDKDKVFYYLGRINEYKKDTAQALAMYDSVLNYSPDQNKTIEKIRDIYAEQNNYQKALEYNEMLIENAGPENDKVWVDKGNYHLMLRDTVQAIQAWEKAFEIFPGNYNIGMTLANYYDKQGMHQKANAIRSKATSFRQQNQAQQGRQ
ncbi:MAG: tetratricopeptide repeat protein [Bacteroidales bacterium]